MKRKDSHISELLNEIQLLKKEKEAYQVQDNLFRALVGTAVGEIGEDFFNKIVIRLSEWLNAECVIIGLMTADNTVEGFPMYLDGEIIQGFAYNLKDTPCDMTSRKGFCIFSENVAGTFPNSKDLHELNIQGYVGTALYNKDGQPNGILSAMSRKKLKLPVQAEEIMSIVGSRVSTEIERLKAVKALEISEMNLRTANASKDRLFSIIAHDLKSPFNSLIGFSKLQIEHIDNKRFERVSEYARIIYDVSSQTHVLLSNLLEWSMVQTNILGFHPQTYLLADICTESLGFYKNQASQKNITLNIDISSDIKVVADINMITIVVRNLISNALKYSYPGGAIAITAAADQEKVVVTVSDTGIGISAENLARLFRIESSFSTNGTGNEKGTGIGLILCRDLVHKHHGEIWVESAPTVGSKFMFTLPSGS
jgi:signal transduction histidine kinase